jgi:hypothetical protein
MQPAVPRPTSDYTSELNDNRRGGYRIRKLYEDADRLWVYGRPSARHWMLITPGDPPNSCTRSSAFCID